MAVSVNAFCETVNCDRLRKWKRPPPKILRHFARRLDFVTAYVNVSAMPREIIFVVVIHNLNNKLRLELWGLYEQVSLQIKPVCSHQLLHTKKY